MTEVRELLALVVMKFPVFIAHFVSFGDVAGFLSVLLFAIVIDGFTRRDGGRYRSAAFRVDIIYALFYLGGVYTFLVGLPYFKALMRIMASLKIQQPHLLATLPVAVQIVIGLVVVDLFSYLWHRTVHTNRFLWAFHSVHHSQRELSVATGFRTHFADEIVRTTFIFVPLYALNIQPHAYVVMDLIMSWILGLQHSGLPWSYGWIGRAVVSPSYHRIHHSIDRIDRDKNFGVLFPVWDRLFGTAAVPREAAPGYGLADAVYPESFVRQLAVPFLVIARSFSVDRLNLSAPPADRTEAVP